VLAAAVAAAAVVSVLSCSGRRLRECRRLRERRRVSSRLMDGGRGRVAARAQAAEAGKAWRWMGTPTADHEQHARRLWRRSRDSCETRASVAPSVRCLINAGRARGLFWGYGEVTLAMRDGYERGYGGVTLGVQPIPRIWRISVRHDSRIHAGRILLHVERT